MPSLSRRPHLHLVRGEALSGTGSRARPVGHELAVVGRRPSARELPAGSRELLDLATRIAIAAAHGSRVTQEHGGTRAVDDRQEIAAIVQEDRLHSLLRDRDESGLHPDLSGPRREPEPDREEENDENARPCEEDGPTSPAVSRCGHALGVGLDHTRSMLDRGAEEKTSGADGRQFCAGAISPSERATSGKALDVGAMS